MGGRGKNGSNLAGGDGGGPESGGKAGGGNVVHEKNLVKHHIPEGPRFDLLLREMEHITNRGRYTKQVLL